MTSLTRTATQQQKDQFILSPWFWIIPTLLAVFLIIVSQNNFLLFHTLAELFAIIVAIILCVVAWQMYPLTKNDFLMYLGCGYFWIGVLDMAHTLVYKGMHIYDIVDANPSTQFWIATRYLEALLLLSAPWFLTRKLNRNFAFFSFMLISAVAYLLIMGGNFPISYIEGQGLTAFKVNSEYIIIAILACAIIFLWKHRSLVDQRVTQIMIFSILLTMCAELAFTFYVSVYGFSNLVGHIFKLFSYWLIFMAMIRVTLQEPLVALSRGASTYDAIPDATIVVGNDGTICDVNREACRLAGKSAAELLGEDSHEVFHPKIPILAQCPICVRVSKGKEVSGYELELPELNRWYDYSLTPISDTSELTGSVQVVRDISSRKNAENSLKQHMERKEIILKSSRDGFLAISMDGVILEVNDACCIMFGVQTKEMIGQNISKIYLSREDTEVLSVINDKLQKNEHDFSLHLKRKDEKFIDIEVNVTLLKQNEDESFFFLVIQDVSERIGAEKQLYELNELKNSIVENLPAMLFVKDAADHRYVEWNKAAAELTGYEKKQMLGCNDFDFFAKEEAQFYIDMDKKVLSDGILIDIPDEPITTKHKGVRRLHTRKIPIYDKQGEAKYLLGISEDITEKLHFEQTIRRTQKMDAIGQLSGGIAHDFNNQLGVVIGYIDLLKERIGNDQQLHGWLDTASKAVHRCTDLTRQLLAFSRRQSKEKTIVDLSELVNEMKDMIYRSVTPAVSVKFICTDNTWLTELDSGEFQDALLNLVINSRDAMAKDGELSIEIKNMTVDEDYASVYLSVGPGEYVLLSVSDSGVGMSKQTLERIFEPFFTTKVESKGTGLGLAMVYGFAQRYKGAIRVYSEEKVGTTVNLFLPRSMSKTPDPIYENLSSELLPKGSETILIVDDEKNLLNLANIYLQDLGYQTFCAEDASGAMDVLRQQKIDLLFSDIVMPGGINGYELAQQAMEFNSQLKILLTSGFAANENLSKDLEFLTNNLLGKPYRKYELAHKIRELFEVN